MDNEERTQLHGNHQNATNNNEEKTPIYDSHRNENRPQ
jgi:hypothetical protein